MGKQQHTTDRLHVRPTEWAQDGAGYKVRGKNPFAKLPLGSCFLSLQPFKTPVATRDGQVFEVAFIIAYIKKYKVNPVTGGRLDVNELVPLQFHYNEEGKIRCPVIFKEFTAASHVVANMASGHVYSFEAVQELNRKQKNYNDLITSQPFKWSDIVVLQDPDNIEPRLIEKFHFMQAGQQDYVVQNITHKESDASKEAKKKTIRSNAALERIFEEKQERTEETAKEKAKDDAEKAKEAAERGEQPQALVDMRERKTNVRYTSGEMAESFTSTSTPLTTKNPLRLMTDEEDLQDIYDIVRKKKQKGYVRVVTSHGALNIEVQTDIVPRTSDNFLRLCERNYYNDIPFHRLIHNFMMQGGDPTGTGRGGESAYENGRAFADEFDSRLSHQGPGIVSMANNGKGTNRSQFFVTLKSCQHLDNKHSIFGRVVGGLQLLPVFNDWGVDEKDKPIKEIKLLRTEVFKNPFNEAMMEAAKPKVEKIIDPAATWFSNRQDPMENHRNRLASGVGKYMDTPVLPLPGEKKRKDAKELPEEEMEYAGVVQKTKKGRTAFDFSVF